MNNLIEKIKNQLPSIIVSDTVNHKQLIIEVGKENVTQLLQFIKQNPEPGYDTLVDYTGVDYIQPETKTKIVYWLLNPSTFERVRVITYVRRDELMPSITDLWEGADWYERELFDLFGVKFEGHPDLKRILMPDDWKGHPLRRDYPLKDVSVQFKHGVKPKPPSEIIPHVEYEKT